jgi:hypothetical protein
LANRDANAKEEKRRGGVVGAINRKLSREFVRASTANNK